MAQTPDKLPKAAREEDYRDYEDRNIGDGWPYADEDREPGAVNTPYGRTSSNFDESDLIGAEISKQPAIDSGGGSRRRDAS